MKLPFVIERALAEIKALQIQTGSEHAQKLMQEGDIRLSCKKGCFYCCHYPFLVTIAEGLLLHRALSSRGCWTSSLRESLTKNRGKTLGLSLEVWLLSNTPCPLLEDNLCMAYDVRPLHCRVTYSVGDPEMCHPHGLGKSTLLIPNSEVVIDYNEKLQTILSRANVFGFIMPLSESLLLADSLEKGVLPIEDIGKQFVKDFNV